MQRVYIENDTVKITRRQDDYLLNVEWEDGTCVQEVQARCLFPIKEPNNYIALLDTEGKELAIIRDLSVLSAESANAVKTVLEEYYLIPRITKIIRFEGKPGNFYITAETDRGVFRFKITSRQQSIKALPNYRALIRDSNDNRYEIVDYRTLDRKSLNYLLL